MKNTFSPFLLRIWRTARPWVASLMLLIVLRYTGVLSAISYAAGTVLLKTGIMNASVEQPAVMHDFTYDFVLQDLNGKVVDVRQLRHKALFINMWATWCGPCRVEMPSIESLYHRADTSRIAFLLISVDKFDQQFNVKKYVADRGFTFPVYTPVGTLPSMLQVPSIPTTFIVDTTGSVVMKEVGVANYNTAKIRKFLKSL